MKNVFVNCAEYVSSDEYEVDPEFELLKMSLPEEDESPEKTFSCPVCGMEVTEFELAINGACPGCDTKPYSDFWDWYDSADVPF
jgi:hypothetical protein